MRALYQFNGGVHPPQHKDESTQLPIAVAPVPKFLTIPVQQHIGNHAKPVVSVGEHVLKGQLIAEADGYVSVSVHASTSGIITAIEDRPIPHPSGLADLCICLEADGEDRWVEHAGIDYRHLGQSELRNFLRDCGIAGLGGAVFPTFIKLNRGKHPVIPTLILNGAECEPFISCDDMLMRERAEEIIQGIEVLQFALASTEILIGIEDNKPQAIQAMQAAAKQSTLHIDVVPVPTIYPGGGAKQLTKVLTGQEVPAGQRSMDIGIACFNVATAYSVHRAVHLGEPLISRIVTITGDVGQAQNFEARIGTPISELVSLAGHSGSETDHYVMGGPMMGFNLPSAQVPVVKATNCIIASAPKVFAAPPPAMPCIRCAKCAEACPADLQPQELYWFAKGKNFDKAQEYALFDCIECGCCSYVCPSHIPLVQFYRFAKSEIWAREKEKKAADLARERYDFRLFRIEREKQEKAERHAQKIAGAAASKEGADAAAPDAKKAAIEAAIERAKAKKAEITPKNTDNLAPAVAAEIAEIDARREKAEEIAAQINEARKE